MIGIQEIRLKKYCQNFLLYCIKRIQIVLMIIMIIQEEMNLLIIEHYLTKKLNISQKNIQRLLLNLKNFQMYICFRQFLDLLEIEYTFLDFLLFLVHRLLNDLEQNHALISFLFYLFLILIKINHHYYQWKDCIHIHKQHKVSQSSSNPYCPYIHIPIIPTFHEYPLKKFQNGSISLFLHYHISLHLFSEKNILPDTTPAQEEKKWNPLV